MPGYCANQMCMLRLQTRSKLLSCSIGYLRESGVAPHSSGTKEARPVLVDMSNAVSTTDAYTRDPVSSCTCGSLTSSVQERATTPGRTKHARLSTCPLVIASSPAMPFHSQMIFFSPRYSFRFASMPSRPRLGFLLGCSRHSSVQIRVLQPAAHSQLQLHSFDPMLQSIV